MAKFSLTIRWLTPKISLVYVNPSYSQLNSQNGGIKNMATFYNHQPYIWHVNHEPSYTIAAIHIVIKANLEETQGTCSYVMKTKWVVA